MEYRVHDQLRHHHVDPAADHLAEPLTAAAEWDRVARLLDTAEIHSLSRRHLADLCHEKRDLYTFVGGPTPSETAALHREVAAAEAAHDQTAARLIDTRRTLSVETDRRRPDRRRVADLRRQIGGLERRHAEEALRLDLCRQRLDAAGVAPDPAGLAERHDLISAAIDLIVDDAIAAAAAHPATYLTALLGARPADADAATRWDRAARSVEAWRHHHLGLNYGQPAAGPDAPQSHQALGPIPDNPIDALNRRRILERTQGTLDLGVSR